MSNETPTPQAEPAPVPAREVPADAQASPVSLTKSNRSLKILLLIFGAVLCFFIILLIILYVLSLNAAKNNSAANDQNQTPADTNQNTDQNPQQNPPAPTLADNKVFYLQSNNVYSYDVDSKVIVKLTNYPANPTNTPATDADGNPIPSRDLRSLRVIDGENIGFLKCDIVTGDFGCGVEVLDLNTNTVSEKKALANDALALTVGFSTTNKFAYLYTNDSRWRVIYNNAGAETTLEDIDIGAYGRGGYVEDSEKIRFSPDGNQVLEISTSSPRNVSDFNIYVYNLTNNTTKTIAHATQPEWLNNTTLVYRAYTSGGANNGLSTYDLSTNTSTKIAGVSTTSYNPSVLTGTQKIVYTDEASAEVMMFDLDSNLNTQIATMAKRGFWVSSTKIAFIEQQVCVNEDDCMMEGLGSYLDKSFDIYDVDASLSEVTTLTIGTVGGISNPVSNFGGTY